MLLASYVNNWYVAITEVIRIGRRLHSQRFMHLLKCDQRGVATYNIWPLMKISRRIKILLINGLMNVHFIETVTLRYHRLRSYKWQEKSTRSKFSTRQSLLPLAQRLQCKTQSSLLHVACAHCCTISLDCPRQNVAGGNHYSLNPVAAQSHAEVCARSLAGFVGLHPTGGMGFFLSLVSVVCCQVEVSATGWSLVQRSPTSVIV
jgi:hypothetical protein